MDKDPEMIRQAEKEGDSPIRYVASPVDGMPFETCKFDAVTAFSAFHWFTDKASIREIKRVLKAGGVFFVVNRNRAPCWEITGTCLESSSPETSRTSRADTTP